MPSVRAQSLTEGKLEEALRDLGMDWDQLLKTAGQALGIPSSEIGTLETADTVVGGSWPSRLLGSARGCCEDCRDYVSLAPSTQRMLAARPGIRVICLRCARKQVARQD